MLSEIREIPEATQRLLRDGQDATKEAGAALRSLDPSVLITIARGSSDHAASYLKYAFEISLGVPVASVGPSIASVYESELRLENAAALAISQSGQSPDIVKMTDAAGKGGALTLALTNDPTSPMARMADQPVGLYAGPETSVAATKTFVSTIVAGLLILAHWRSDEALLAAIAALPETFDQAIQCDWSKLVTRLDQNQIALTLGRGPSFAICKEAALKLKEVAQIAAFPYSSAEVMHGPVSIVGPGVPVLVFAGDDKAAASGADVSAFLSGAGADVFVTGRELEVPASNHALTAALIEIVCFYVMVEELARMFGLDPDAPRHLNKVTRTV